MLSSISGRFFSGRIPGNQGPLPPAPPPPAPVGAGIYYQMADGSFPGTGQTITDLTGNGYNLTLTNTDYLYTAARPSNIGWTTTNIGATSLLPTNVLLPWTNNYISMSLWVKFSNLNNRNLASYLEETDVQGMALILNNNSFALQIQRGGSGIASNFGSPSTNQWYFVGLEVPVSSSNNIRAWLNGNQMNSFPTAIPYFIRTTRMRLMMFQSTTNFQWGEFQLSTTSTPTDFAARFAATRSYYGV